MVYYVIFFGINLFLFFFIKNTKHASLLMLATLVLFAGLRGNVGNDTCQYKLMFYDISFANLQQYSNTEPLYNFLELAFKTVSNNAQLFLLLVSVIQGSFLYGILKNVHEKRLFLLVFICTYYYQIFFNTLRFGLATMMLGYGFSVFLKYQKRLSLGLLAPMFHIAVIPTLLLLLVPLGVTAAVITVAVILIYSQSSVIFLLSIAFLQKLDVVLSFGKYFTTVFSTEVSFGLFVTVILSFVAILVAAREWRYRVLFILLIPVVYLVFTDTLGRIAPATAFCLLVYVMYHWPVYGFYQRTILYIYFLFIFVSGPLYTILWEDSQVLKLQAMGFQGDINSTNGDYHFWFENSWKLCDERSFESR